MIVYAGLMAVRFALPPDPYGPVRVESLPGYSAAAAAEPTKVTYDAASGHTYLEITETGGAVRRYRVTQDGDGWRVYEAPQ